MNHIKTFEEFKIKFENQYVDEYSILDDTFEDFDLSLIPKDSLKKQYVNFKFNKVISEYGSPVSEASKQLICLEGVQHTFGIDDVKDSISKKYGLKDWQFLIKEGDNDIKIALVIPHISMNEQFIVDDMYALGYYENYREFEEEDGLVYTIIKFDPIYPKDITNEVRTQKNIRHLTPKYNLESIIKYGFIPQSSNSKFKYPPRLHFLKEDIDLFNIKHLGRQLNKFNDNKNNTGEYLLFTIDVSLIPKNVKFIGDSSYKFGICTYQSIPYNSVIKIEECNFNNNIIEFKEIDFKL